MVICLESLQLCTSSIYVCWLGLELYELLMVSMFGNYPAIMDCVLPENQEEDHVVLLIPPPRSLWDFLCVFFFYI